MLLMFVYILWNSLGFMCEILQLPFCDWLILCDLVTSRSVHSVVNASVSLLFRILNMHVHINITYVYSVELSIYSAGIDFHSHNQPFLG